MRNILIILLLILFNTGVVYSQSNTKKRYKKAKKVKVDSEYNPTRADKKLARIEKRQKRKKKRLGKKIKRGKKKGLEKQNKYSIDKPLANRSKRTGTEYDKQLKRKATYTNPLEKEIDTTFSMKRITAEMLREEKIKSSSPLTYEQVQYNSAKDAKLKRKVAKKVKKANKKLTKKNNYGREKGQIEQSRVYKKMRKAGRKTKRVIKGKKPTPLIQRIFRKKRGRGKSRKKE